MKKPITIILVFAYICLHTMTYASQDNLFDITYHDLINQLTTEPAVQLSDVVETNNNIDIKINNTESNNNMNINGSLSYHQVAQQKINGLYQEGTMDLNLNIDIEALDINTITLQSNIEFKNTPVNAFIKINTVDIKSDSLSIELQEIISTIQSAAQSKRIKVPIADLIDNDEYTAALTQSTFNPQLIINALQQYPLINNAGYSNNTFTITLNTDNILTLLKQYNIIDYEQEHNDLIETESYETYYNNKIAEYDTIISPKEFKNLSYDEYISLLQEQHPYDQYITKKKYRSLKKLYTTDETAFISQMEDYIYNHTSYTLDDIEEQKELQEELMRYYYNDDTEGSANIIELEQNIASEIYITSEAYYRLLHQLTLLPSQVDFYDMDYDGFLSSVYGIQKESEYLSDQQDWNEYVVDNYNPEQLQKELSDFIDSMDIQGSLSTDKVPSLQLTLSASEELPMDASLIINKNNLLFTGYIQESYEYEDGKTDETETNISLGLHNTGGNNTHYTMNIAIKDTSSWYNPSNFVLGISGASTTTYKNSHRFYRPGQAITIDEIMSNFLMIKMD